jgi:hypothetical protein
MMPLKWIRRLSVPGALLLVAFVIWGVRSSRGERNLSRPAGEGSQGTPMTRIPKPPGGGVFLAPPPREAIRSEAISPPAPVAKGDFALEVEARRTIEESFLDLRVALILHDKTLGEKVYPILRRRSDLAIQRAQECLRSAQDPFEREVATRALALLTAPPTHGLLRHFQW